MGCSVTGVGQHFNMAQRIALLRQAGWPDVLVNDSDGSQNNLLVIMAAIMEPESGGWSGAENHCGENSIGLLQVNLDAWGHKWSRQQLLDPLTNCQAAYQVYRQQGLHAWGPYQTGIYASHLADAWKGYGGGGSARSPTAVAGIPLPGGITSDMLLYLGAAAIVFLLLFDD